jgi:predicted transcriptional regulator
MKTHAKMHRTQLYIPQTQAEHLRQLAKFTGLTASEHMRRALHAYIAPEVKRLHELHKGTKDD